MRFVAKRCLSRQTNLVGMGNRVKQACEDDAVKTERANDVSTVGQHEIEFTISCAGAQFER